MSLLLARQGGGPPPTPDPTNRTAEPPINYFRYAVTRPRGQRVKVVQSFEVK